MIALLPKENLIPFLHRIGGKMEVIAPVFLGQEPAFITWKGQPLALERNTLMPPIEFLLPQREVLFRYVQESGRYTFEEGSQKARLVFGVRPCDLQSAAVLDRIFGSDPRDSAYFGRRRWTIIAALNCTRPGEGCSCAGFGSGPQAASMEGLDLLFTELSDGYLAEIGSPAGMMVLQDCPDLLSEADEGHILEKRRLLDEAKGLLQAGQDRLHPSLHQMRQAIRDADWEALGKLCLSCGGCTFVCPVCHCFNVVDQGIPDGERMRCRDTCILSGFSRMAGGANPRKSAGERLKNWYLDKFEYIPQKTGMVGCVGCGRCNRTCLAEIDRLTLEAKR